VKTSITLLSIKFLLSGFLSTVSEADEATDSVVLEVPLNSDDASLSTAKVCAKQPLVLTSTE